MKKITSNIVYSTNPDFESENIEDLTMSAQSNQNLRIHLERKRGGKILTDEILIQGNVREKVLSILTEKGYSAKLSGG